MAYYYYIHIPKDFTTTNLTMARFWYKPTHRFIFSFTCLVRYV